MVPEKIRRIKLEISEEDLLKDSERYCIMAKELGADDARTITTADIPIDDRVVLKCRIPKCFGYGTSAHCPPYSLKPDETREVVNNYRRAVVIIHTVRPEVIVRDRATINERVEAYKKIFHIVSAIESAAFYDGYYFSLGFAAGSCKSTFCYNVECTVLKGEKCRLSLRARPSMEAVGIDCYRLATMLGWEIYPIGSDAKPHCIPHGVLMGLVLID